jgi:ATP-binding cassette subfamily B protein
MTEKKSTFTSAWRDRLTAMRNIPPVLRIVWQSGPWVVSSALFARVVVSAVPVGVVNVSSRIIQDVSDVLQKGVAVPKDFWWLVAAEFGLAIVGTVGSRIISFVDTLLADRYSRHVSILVLEHASKLDLASYENPLYYDRLERARVQATDRLVMIQATGQLVQQVLTTVFFAGPILLFSPWLLLLLLAFITPAFLGESHFAFLGYALSLRQTPRKRVMDYLRILGGSKEAAKELKLFGLRDFLAKRFRALWDGVYEENLHLAS